MEGSYLGKMDVEYKTGVGAEWKNDADATEAFESIRQYEMDIHKAEFLIDLYEDDGVMIDTIAVNAENYTKITGEPVRTKAEYIKTNHKYWTRGFKAI